MTDDRHLDWDGCYNARDLGGLPARNGRRTRWGAVVRSENLDRLAPGGWSALLDHGIRTVIDLRNDDERAADGPSRPAEVSTVHLPLDDVADTRFWQPIWDDGLDATPLYYPLFLRHKPHRCAAVISAIAGAPPGGVLIHCAGGRDRTGLIALLLLDLVGVSSDDIAADYEQSAERLPPLFAELGVDGHESRIHDILDRRNTTARAAIHTTLESIDIPACLLAAGLTRDDLTAIRTRLLEPVW